MKKYLISLVLLIPLFGTPAFADSQKGHDAYEREDYATALKEWKPLADEGDAKAQNNLGVMYARGQGVTQDYKEAVKWFKLAAEQGDKDAQYNLGRMYRTGRGVNLDKPRAHFWFNISASQGHKDAAKQRDELTEEMTSENISKAQDMARECVAKNYKDC